MEENKTHKGACFCGAVELEVAGSPELMAYCHCDSCRKWSAGPVNAATLWKPENLKITKGEEHIDSFNKTEGSTRKWCKLCGGHIMTDHPAMGLTDVYAATIPEFPFEAAVHLNYAETVLHIRDGKPKFKDLPAEAGGTGEEISE